MASPVTVTEVAGGVPDTTVGVLGVVPTNGVTVYDVMGLPPFAGAVQDTVTEPMPATAERLVGASGADAWGVTAFEGADAGPVPTLLVALTVNV